MGGMRFREVLVMGRMRVREVLVMGGVRVGEVGAADVRERQLLMVFG